MTNIFKNKLLLVGMVAALWSTVTAAGHSKITLGDVQIIQDQILNYPPEEAIQHPKLEFFKFIPCWELTNVLNNIFFPPKQFDNSKSKDAIENFVGYHKALWFVKDGEDKMDREKAKNAFFNKYSLEVFLTGCLAFYGFLIWWAAEEGTYAKLKNLLIRFEDAQKNLTAAKEDFALVQFKIDECRAALASITPKNEHALIIELAGYERDRIDVVQKIAEAQKVFDDVQKEIDLVPYATKKKFREHEGKKQAERLAAAGF